MKCHHICLFVVLLILRPRPGVLLAGGVLVCSGRVHAKKKGRGESELCYHILFTHSSAFITLPVSSSCWGFARKLCEPAKEVASFNRHLVSLPIAFTKIALMGCLERKSALISLNFLFH